jgi:hypothetical protein
MKTRLLNADVKIEMILSLNEYRALYDFIGNTSIDSRKEFAGLTDEQSRFLADMFNDLVVAPYNTD